VGVVTLAKSVFKKRVQTVGAIAAAATATAGTSGAPTPLLELPKQSVIAMGDIALCVAIYMIWYDTRITNEEMIELLKDGGMLAVVGGALVYGGVKVTEGLLAEALNLLGPLGWGVSAAITASVTGMVGLTFWMLCERAPAWLTAAAA
jgi:hypothetical protein